LFIFEQVASSSKLYFVNGLSVAKCSIELPADAVSDKTEVGQGNVG